MHFRLEQILSTGLMQKNVVWLPVSWRTVHSLDIASIRVTEQAHQTYWQRCVEISGASNTRTEVSVGVKNIEEIFSGNPDETARAVCVPDETQTRAPSKYTSEALLG